jgi:amino acid permease
MLFHSPSFVLLNRGHFSAPDFYHSVSPTEPGTGVSGKMSSSTKGDDNSEVLKDYFKVTSGGFFAALCINCLIMAFGFLTFGGNSMGVILNNYSTKDVGASICRLLMAVSIIGGYPFLVSACRGEILSLWKLKSRRLEVPEKLVKKVTSTLLLCITMAAMVVSNAGFVIGLSGAVMGSVIGYIFPCLLFLSSTGTATTSSSQMTMSIRSERMLCRILISFGVVAALAGGAVSIINNYFPHLLV